MLTREAAASVAILGVLGFAGLPATGLAQQGAAAQGRQSATSQSRTTGDPAFQYAGTDGCAQVMVYAWSDDRTEVFRVDWDVRAALGIPPGEKMTWHGVKTFDLRNTPRGLRVAIDMHQSAVYSIYCTPVMRGLERRTIWSAVEGTLTIDVGENTGTESLPAYPVTAVLRNAVFESPNGKRAPVFEIVVKATAGRPVGG
jgi:hypothetical protein